MVPARAVARSTSVAAGAAVSAARGLNQVQVKPQIEKGVGMILGDRSLAMAELYSREHEKKGRVTATMLKLESVEREPIGRGSGKL
jgi:hypothetical protein